jgi:CheY-like chemotaxis protein
VEQPTLVGFSILVVERHTSRASRLRQAIEDAGACVLPAATSTEASKLLSDTGLSAAVLDYTESITSGHGVPRQLTALGIPFLFLKEIGLNEAWPHAPVLSKPVNNRDLIEALLGLLSPSVPPRVGWRGLTHGHL